MGKRLATEEKQSELIQVIQNLNTEVGNVTQLGKQLEESAETATSKATIAVTAAQNASNYASQALAVAAGASSAPVGTVMSYAGSTAPDGWLVCDGSAVSRTTYSDLFTVIGTTYGSGNGTSTFNLPDLRDKFIEGSSTTNTVGTSKTAGLPNIEGTFNAVWEEARGAVATGAFSAKNEGGNNEASGTAGSGGRTWYYDASESNSIYGNSDTVQPPAVAMLYIIKWKAYVPNLDPIPIVDPTLTISGAAADAKVTGFRINQTAEVGNQIVYFTENEKSWTYRTLTCSKEGYDFTINGTSDATIKLKISGAIGSAIASSYPGSWTKTIPFLQDHYYKLSVKVISGTYTSESAPLVRFVDDDNTQLANLYITDGNSKILEGNGKNGLIYIYAASGKAMSNYKFRIVFEDVTEEYTQNEMLKEHDDAIKYLIDGSVTENVPLTSGKYYISSSITVGSTMYAGTSSSNGLYAVIDVSQCQGGGKVKMTMATLVSNSTVSFAFADANNTVISKGVTSSRFAYDSDAGVYTATFNIVRGKYMYFSAYTGSSTTLGVEFIKPDAGNPIRVRYVAPDGDDNNDGLSSASPLATINKALENGGHTILLAGGQYFQQIDMSKAVDEIKLAPSVKDGLPIIYATGCLITDTETAVAGFNNVFSCPCTKTFDDKNIWIFQEGVPDVSTLIDVNDRHPLQRGKACRCDDTKITLCSSNNLVDALNEIENASTYKWYIDTDNDTLYFSRPSVVTASTPIMASFGSSLFTNRNRGKHIEMVGIGVKYQKVDLRDTLEPIVTDCFCGNVRGEAGFQWDGTAGAKLYRCEAFRVFFTSSSGDGFNAHGDKTGDAFSKQSTCFLVDCWSHDNCDDGYSDHERCEISIFGGLFENNGAGVTPAVGSHCTCYNVLSRYNGEADFFYTGNPVASEGGVGGQIACYGCVSKGKGSGRGYRLNGSEIQGLFVNCVAIDRATGFYSESNGGTQVGTLINCTTVNCSTPKSAIFTALNGTPVV